MSGNLPDDTYIVIGGGAAGFFTAIHWAENNPSKKVIILEKGQELLGKVRISGGGRCNVTHACFEAGELIKFYPRGSKELLGPFTRFGPKETIDWFARRGVRIKREEDGRMFPITDSSETIVDCLMHAARQAGVQIRTGAGMAILECPSETQPHFIVRLISGEIIEAQKVAICSGSSAAVWKSLEKLGYEIEPPVPSLFTFNIPGHPITKLMGISVPEAQVRLAGSKLSYTGPLLVTHWGLSGPAVLKLSAWGAQYLAGLKYHCEVLVNWLPQFSVPEAEADFNDWLQSNLKKQAATMAYAGFPKRLWLYFLEQSGIPETLVWAQLNKKQRHALFAQLTNSSFSMKGKTTFKEEFVTAGGIRLNQVDFKSFQSRKHPGLYFGGEVLNIDGITGGFNFQAAWTAGYMIGSS